MTCGKCGSALFSVRVTAMLGVVGSQVSDFAAGVLVCESCSEQLEGVHVSTSHPTASRSWFSASINPGADGT